MRSYSFLLPGVFFLLGMFSCQIQERRYQPGFYLSSKQHRVINDKKLAVSTHPGDLLPEARLALAAPPKKNAQTDTCDILTFNDGTQIKARIIEVTTREIKYRYCDGDTKVRIARRSTVLSIVYATGDKQTTAPTPTQQITPPVTENTPQPKPDTAAVSSITLPPVPSDTNKKKVSCDKIVFRDGTEDFVKVMEIGVENISYHACDMQDGPVFVKPKSAVFMISFPDGSREVFKEEAIVTERAPTEIAPYQPPVRTKSGLAVTAFIFSLAGIFPLYIVGSVLGIIMAGIYLEKARKEPEVYISTKFAQVAITIGAIVLAIWAGIFLIGAF